MAILLPGIADGQQARGGVAPGVPYAGLLQPAPAGSLTTVSSQGAAGMSLGGAGAPGGVTPHPFQGTGFRWWDAAALPSLFQDAAGTTPVTAAGQSVRRVAWLEGASAGGAFFSTGSAAMVWADGSSVRAINGKAVIYDAAGGTGSNLDTVSGADALLTGQEFVHVQVLRRLAATDDNQETFTLGANRPCPFGRMYTGAVIRAEAFITGFVQAAATLPAGPHVVVHRFKGTTLRVSVDGGAEGAVAQTAAWLPDTGTWGIGNGLGDRACAGLYDGDFGDAALSALVASLKSYYGIA